MKKLTLFLFLLTFHLAKSQSTLITPNSGGNGNFLFKSTGANYGQFSTTASGASLVLRVNEPAANNGTTGLITGAIYSDATRTVLAGFTDSGQLYGINKVEIGTNAVSNRMVMLNNGNVGIGVTNPASKLDILGIDNWNLGGGSAGDFRVGNSTYNFRIGVALGGGGAGDTRVYSSHRLLFGVGTSDKMTVTSSGNVGIGTITPTYRLHVVGDIKLEGADFVMGPVTGRGLGGRALVLDVNNMLSINFANDFSGGTFINSNVGIGTLPSNSYKLAINGTARTKEVIVETGWADYVFEKEYRLSSLNEVESFIKENKHLPDVPSAKEIQEKGAFVGELMTKMMQKIEELTLYSIEQEKKIGKLQCDIIELRNR